MVEGKTEKAFVPFLRAFLESHLLGKMPTLSPNVYNHRIPTEDSLRRRVVNLLDGPNPSDGVIALTDVYTGSKPPEFFDALDAKRKMRQWVGNEARFYPHAAQFDFEAWLLPYWPRIQQLAKHNRTAPSGNPEMVNHNKPPSKHIQEIFRLGDGRNDYVKTRDAGRILKDADLNISIQQCSELKSLVNTILSICGGQTVH